MDFEQTIKTDVLIIGSGGAGLCAAIAAKKKGADVLVISKGRPGRSNNTAISGGIHAVATGMKTSRDTPQLHMEDTLSSGRFINRRDMVQTMVDAAFEKTLNLETCGVSFRKKGDGFWLIHVPGHSVARHVFVDNSFGTGYTFPLAKYAKEIGVDFLSGAFVKQLCRDEHGSIAGAVVFVKNHNAPFLIKSKSVILATGGAGSIYAQNNNAPGTTGDGYAIAYQMGISLRDMEFVQFYPTLMLEPSLPKRLISYEVLVFRGGGKLFNSKGENIALLHGMEDTSTMTRDALSRAMAKEIEEGRGINGAVLLDLADIDKKKLERYKNFIPKSLKGRLSFGVTPVVHHFMGGLLVNKNGETGIEGFYSAGEVNSGVHGANRLGGNALTETWVYGNITGSLAAQYSKNLKQTILDPDFEELENEIKITKNNKSFNTVKNIKKEFVNVMWEKAGIIRTEKKLYELVDDIENIKNKLDKTGAENINEFIKKSELANMIIVGEAVAKSALLRKESRGSHYREDFPDEGGDGWIKNTQVVKDDCEMEVSIG